MTTRRLLLLPLALACGSLAAGDLGAATVAKFIRVIVQGSGVHGVACADKELAGELSNLGVPLDPDSKVAWADTEAEVARLGKLKKLVVCGSRGLLSDGGSVAVVAEGGRPSLIVNARALAASGLTLPDNVMKIAKVMQ